MTIKDSLLIDNGLSLKFWIKPIDTANYQQNCLPIKSQREELIPKENKTGKKQDLNHIKIFGNIISIIIRQEEKYKSDVYKNWKEIFIGYN